jgi:hypothetical protein
LPLRKRKIGLPAQSNFRLAFSPTISSGTVSNISTTLEMIKIEYTLVACFAGRGAAARGLPTLRRSRGSRRHGARTTAMAFNQSPIRL